MTMLKAAFSAGAVLASSTSPGALFLDGSNSDFSVNSCTANEVVISGSGANTLKPGHILAYIEGDKELESDTVCTSCSPLFRKIVEVDGNKFTTTFASFAEVFPKEVYDDSLADMLVEPQLDCEHSSWGKHRKLEDDDDDDDEECADLALAIVILLAISCVFPFCSLCILPAIAMIGYITAGIGACGWDGEDFDPATAAEVLMDNLGVRRLTENKPTTNPDFPSSCSDWQSKDTSGNCLFADCNVGLGLEPSACFGTNFPEVTVNDKISVPDTIVDSFDFGEAKCSRNYCYSSLFDKATCDNQFYANMKASCPSQVAVGSNVIQSSFPLEMSVLTQNCQVVSVLLFLGLKLFGREAYSNSQGKQLEYKHATCDQTSTLQF